MLLSGTTFLKLHFRAIKLTINVLRAYIREALRFFTTLFKVEQDRSEFRTGHSFDFLFMRIWSKILSHIIRGERKYVETTKSQT